MNFELIDRTESVKLRKLLAELTDYKRATSYNLSEIKVIPLGFSWLIVWRKDSN